MKRFIKKLIPAVLIGILSSGISAYAADSFTPAQKTEIQQIIQQYLTQKPEVILQAIQALQQKQYSEAQKTVKETQQMAPKYAKDLFRQANDPLAGNPSGAITVTEFFDYQCPHCVEMAPVIEAIIKANSNVRIVFKDFPIRGPLSELAARAALAANKQGKYYPFSHALLILNQPLTEDLIYKTAAQVGLNVDQLKNDMKDPAIADQLKADMELAKNLKLFGTPAFFIGKTDADANGKVTYIPGRMDQQQLQTEIDKVG